MEEFPELSWTFIEVLWPYAKIFMFYNAVCNLVFSIFTKLCNHHRYLSAEHLHNIPPNSEPISGHSPLPILPPSLETTHLALVLSISMDFSMLDILYKWSHIIYGLLWLASFTWCFKGSLRLSHVSEFHYFFHCWTIYTTCVYYVIYHMCLFIPQLMAIWLVSIFVAIKKNTAMNIHVGVSVWRYVSNSLRCMPRSGITVMW